MRSVLFALVATALAAPPTAAAPSSISPMAFFEGRTLSEGTTKVLMKKPYKVRSHGFGRIEADGSLVLVQQVEEAGEPRKERRWRIRQVSANRFSGTMSEAASPVEVDKVGPRFRFRFRIKGGLAVEQWLTPVSDGSSAESTLVVRKLGVSVATGQATIRKLAN
jgi:hypothetical protein